MPYWQRIPQACLDWRPSLFVTQLGLDPSDLGSMSNLDGVLDLNIPLCENREPPVASAYYLSLIVHTYKISTRPKPSPVGEQRFYRCRIARRYFAVHRFRSSVR